MSIPILPCCFRLFSGLSVALGLSEIAQAAEPLQLSCESRSDQVSEHNYRAAVKIRIDLDNQVIDLIQPTGYVMASTTDKKMNALTPSVRITDTAIMWNLSNSIGKVFTGLIDRETGDTNATWFMPHGTYDGAPNALFYFQGRCRRATQKF